MKKDSTKTGAEFSFSEFYKQLAVDGGLGFRYDFDFFVFRLDAALPVYDPRIIPMATRHWVLQNLSAAQMFKMMNYNIAIGLPF